LPYLSSVAILLSVSTAKIYKKGQLTIPKGIREATGIDVGDRVVVEARSGEIVVRRPRGVLEFEPPQAGGAGLPWPDARRAAREDRTAKQAGSAER